MSIRTVFIVIVILFILSTGFVNPGFILNIMKTKNKKYLNQNTFKSILGTVITHFIVQFVVYLLALAYYTSFKAIKDVYSLLIPISATFLWQCYFFYYFFKESKVRNIIISMLLIVGLCFMATPVRDYFTSTETIYSNKSSTVERYPIIDTSATGYGVLIPDEQNNFNFEPCEYPAEISYEIREKYPYHHIVFVSISVDYESDAVPIPYAKFATVYRPRFFSRPVPDKYFLLNMKTGEISNLFSAEQLPEFARIE